jgi:hypothetical protein
VICLFISVKAKPAHFVAKPSGPIGFLVGVCSYGSRAPTVCRDAGMEMECNLPFVFSVTVRSCVSPICARRRFGLLQVLEI